MALTAPAPEIRPEVRVALGSQQAWEVADVAANLRMIEEALAEQEHLLDKLRAQKASQAAAVEDHGRGERP